MTNEHLDVVSVGNAMDAEHADTEIKHPGRAPEKRRLPASARAGHHNILAVSQATEYLGCLFWPRDIEAGGDVGRNDIYPGKEPWKLDARRSYVVRRFTNASCDTGMSPYSMLRIRDSWSV